MTHAQFDCNSNQGSYPFTRVSAFNNIFYTTGTRIPAQTGGSPSSRISFTNNLYYPNLPYEAGIRTTSDVNADPLFVNPGPKVAAPYQVQVRALRRAYICGVTSLQDSSPAKARGVVSPSVTDDFWQNVRPSGTT